MSYKDCRPGAKQATSAMAGPSRSTWQRDLDVPNIRKVMCKKIYGYFRRHKKYHDWKHRVPKVVQIMEERLLINASTKEEYMDQSTLERRICDLLKSVRAKHKSSRLAANDASFPFPLGCAIPRASRPHLSTMIARNTGDTMEACTVEGLLGQTQPLTYLFAGFGGSNTLSPKKLNPYQFMCMPLTCLDGDQLYNAETIMASQLQQRRCIGSLDSGVSDNIVHLIGSRVVSSMNQDPTFGSLVGVLDGRMTPFVNEMELVHGLNLSTYVEEPCSMNQDPTFGSLVGVLDGRMTPFENEMELVHGLDLSTCVEEPCSVNQDPTFGSLVGVLDGRMTPFENEMELVHGLDLSTYVEEPCSMNQDPTFGSLVGVLDGRMTPFENEMELVHGLDLSTYVEEPCSMNHDPTFGPLVGVLDGMMTPFENEMELVHVLDLSTYVEEPCSMNQDPTFGTLVGVLDGRMTPFENEMELVHGLDLSTYVEEPLQTTPLGGHKVLREDEMVNLSPLHCNQRVQISSATRLQNHNQVSQLQILEDHQLSKLQCGDPENIISEDCSKPLSVEPETPLRQTSDRLEQVCYPDQWEVQPSSGFLDGWQTKEVVHQWQSCPPMEEEAHMSEQVSMSLRPHQQEDNYLKISEQGEAQQFHSPSTRVTLTCHSNGAVSGSGGKMSRKLKRKGVSLTEMFTPEQIKEHIQSLRQCTGQSKLEAGDIQMEGNSTDKNSCQLCGVGEIPLEPSPIYCSVSNDRIKCNEVFYTADGGEKQLYFCNKCRNNHGKSFMVGGVSIPKALLKKHRNSVEIEEAWVQCDKCEAWQHQICALFNPQRNLGGQAEYTCPSCYVKEIGSGGWKPLRDRAFLAAKDLPRTVLSDHIERRLFRSLKQERQKRADRYGKNFDEVQGAEGLVVRVISCTDKKLEAKPQFLKIFKKDDYPSEFPYKSKVIMLFQKIEGVDVSLFSMHVHEFGSECPYPNGRRVYLSYLDSVKYFRPEIKDDTGEALRTFVYHEILIGYLDYCKIQGFFSCHIWASPPSKGDDYILYCHPKMQKLPKSDRLRQWYQSMLQKAIKDNIVVEQTNIYDNFFVPAEKCRAKVSMACFPYFEGDYLPDAIEETLNLLQEEGNGQKADKVGRKRTSRTALKAASYANLSTDATKDIRLMQKLRETIKPMKEDFIIANLQYSCTQCCQFIVSGIRWVCNQHPKFQLCQECYDVEQRIHGSDKHPTKNTEKYSFKAVEVNGLLSNIKDQDEIIGCCISETRHMFLNFFQANHFQYDTLRRAKHSTMMLLYHLHNPNVPISMS